MSRWQIKFADFAEAHHRLFSLMVLAFSFALSTMVFVVLWQSVSTAYGSPALMIRNQQLNIFHTEVGSWMYINADVIVESDTWTYLSRELVFKNNDERIILPSSEYFYPSGQRRINTLFTLPMQISQGEWCLEYTMRYRKPWSMVDRASTTVVGCTTVEPDLNERETKAYPKLPVELGGAA